MRRNKMAIFSENNNLYIKQGDTGNIKISGLPVNRGNYNVYLSIYNPDKNKIIKEFLAQEFVTGTGTATFKISQAESNNLEVGDWEYGVKICGADGTEDTLLPRSYVQNGKLVNEPAPTFTVDYKYVEGEQ